MRSSFLLSLALGALIQLVYLGVKLPSLDPARPLDRLFLTDPWFALLFVSLLGPLVEEVIFRGLLLELLERFLRPVPAAVVVALVFLALHPVNSIPALVLPTALITWARLTKGWWAGLGAHVGFNLMGAIYTVVLVLLGS